MTPRKVPAEAQEEPPTQDVLKKPVTAEAEEEPETQIVLKKPAARGGKGGSPAWLSAMPAEHDPSQKKLPLVPKQVRAANVNSDQDLADGELDQRPTSRSQKWVFEKNLDHAPEEVQAEYRALKDPSNKQHGKQVRINELVNACVPRQANRKSELVVKTASLKRKVLTSDLLNCEL